MNTHEAARKPSHQAAFTEVYMYYSGRLRDMSRRVLGDKAMPTDAPAILSVAAAVIDDFTDQLTIEK